MKRIAVIGSGVSGSVTARLLSTQHQVTVYESASTPGGHAHTVDIEAFGQHYSVDSAFMVFNRRTYPNFCRLLEMLEVTSQPSDMSFSVRCARSGLEYQGSSLNGLFAQRHNCLNPSFLRMLRDILRFNQRGIEAVRQESLDDGQTVRSFLETCRVGPRFIEHYLVPMAAAIWSSHPASILDFPAKFLIGFFANHGLLQIRDRPQWRTITGGSRSYMTALLEPLKDHLRLKSSVRRVVRTTTWVTVIEAGGHHERFDEIVFACHADQALQLLELPTPDETRLLRAFPYQSNEAVLHTDTSVLPRRQRAWASWNYHLPVGRQTAASVTYDLSRLQNIASPGPLLLTLNAAQPIASKKIIREFDFRHPAYSTESVAAQQQFAAISGRNRTHYCGAYWGYGFHEDGVNSGLAVAKHFGIGLDSCTAPCTKASSHTNGEIPSTTDSSTA